MDTDNDTEEPDAGVDMPVECPLADGTETVTYVDVSKKLSREQRKEVDDLLTEYDDVLTDRPGVTADPVRAKGYDIPCHTN